MDNPLRGELVSFRDNGKDLLVPMTCPKRWPYFLHGFYECPEALPDLGWGGKKQHAQDVLNFNCR